MYPPLRARLVTALLCLAALPLPVTGQVTSVLDQALDLESRGQLTQALRTLRAAKPAPDSAEAKHAAALATILRADAQIKEGNTEQARKILDKLLPALDPLRDTYVTYEAYAKLVRLERDDLGKVEREALSDLQEADQLAAGGEYGEALFLYSRVAKIQNLPPHLMRWAWKGEDRTKAAKTQAETPGFFSKTWDAGVEGLSTILVWCAYFGLAVGLVIAGHRHFSRPQEGIGLQVEDWTAEPDRREARNRNLTSEIWRGICQSEHQSRAADIDLFDDLDGVGFSSLRVEIPPFAEVAAVIPEGPPVQLGPFSFSPRQVFAYLQGAFHRPSKVLLRGSLSVEGNETVLFVERIEIEGETLDRWEVREKTRALAVQQMVTRIAFELARERVTPDWRSFQELRQGMGLLRAEGTPESRSQILAEAAHHLKRSLRQDPANWLARFYLASVELKLGRNEMAAQHFGILETLPDRHPEGNFSRFIGQCPSFMHLLRYNRLAALSKAANEGTVWRAIEGLEKLVAAVPQGDRLQILARSAFATALCGLMDRQRRLDWTEDKESRQSRRGQARLLERIGEITSWIDTLKLETRDYSLARAVIYCAYGRALYLTGSDEQVAQAALQEAIAFEPELVDAHIHLAQMFLERRGDALQLAEERLEEASRISPSNQKVHYLLGRLYSDRRRGQYEKAKEHFAKADRFARSHALLADILCEQNRDLSAAIEAMRRSISMSPEPDYRYPKLIGYVLRLNSKEAATMDLLREARQWAGHLAQKGRDERLRQKGEEMKDRVQRAMERLAQKTAAKEPAGTQ